MPIRLRLSQNCCRKCGRHADFLATTAALTAAHFALDLSRLQTEAVHLGHKYGTINYDRQDGTWLHIARFPLGPGWNKTFVELLLDVPHGAPGYPQVAPTWFWTDRDLRTQDGRSINHFFIGGSSHADNIHLDKG